MTTVLVVGSGYQRFREYLLVGVARVATVVLLGDGPPTWQRRYIADYAEVSLDDRAGWRVAAAELARRHPFDAVLTWDERWVIPAAEIAQWLGVAALPLAAANACRDKLRQREALAVAGVPSARHRLAASLAQAREAAVEMGFPLVVKPRSRAASAGVRVVDDDAALAAAVEQVLADRDGPPGYGGFGGGLLVEEFLRGAEVSVDAWVLDGEVTPFAVARKRLAFPPYRVEVGHIMGAPLPEREWPAIRAVVTAANRALGVDRCVTHTEVILTAGGPRIVEVNGRLGGDLIPYLAELSTPGLSAGEIAARVAIGRRPGRYPAPSRVAGVHFVYPPHDMRFRRLLVPAALRTEPWVHEIVDLGSPGQEMRLPPAAFLDRAGYAIALGDDLAGVAHRLDTLAARLVVVGDPLHRPGDDTAARCPSATGS